jgi:hypothetical protein
MKTKALDFLKRASSMMMDHKILSGILLITVIWLPYHFLSGTASAAVTYQYGTVKRGTLSSVVSATGQVAPDSQVDLKPKVNANVVGVNVKAGDRVKAGQVLFRLDATDAYKQVRDAKTALASANIALEKLRNPKTIDLLSINDAIAQDKDSEKSQNDKVDTAYKNLLNGGLQAIPDVSYTTETAPTISGSYQKGKEGQIKVTVYQGGNTGYSFSLSGLATGTGDVSTISAQPLGDTGLFIKWNGSNPQTNWIILTPNQVVTSPTIPLGRMLPQRVILQTPQQTETS